MPSLRQLSLLLGALFPLGSLAAPFNFKNLTVPSTTIHGRYIVTLKHGLTARDLDSHVSWVNQVHKRSLDEKNGTAAGVHKTFDHIHVYVGEFDDDTVEQIKSRMDVEAVEEDQLWTVSDIAVPDPIDPTRNPIYDAVLKDLKDNGKRDDDPVMHPTGAEEVESDPIKPASNPLYNDILQARAHLHAHGTKSAETRSQDATEESLMDTMGTPQSPASEPSAPWGLARISHRARGANSYVYDPSAGRGTYAYVVDTGLNTNHSDFGGRARFGYNAVAGSADADVQGHGTHATGIVGGGAYGVAKAAQLVAVKVFDRGGSLTSVILDGYNWAVADIGRKNRVGRAVINMSLGGGTSAAFDSAVRAAYAAGVVTVVAAGNQARDVGSESPASAPAAVTVGAVDGDDKQASYSNFGKAVDIYAPGSNILSTWIGSASATATMSGTSMACPHVSGLVLYLMAKEGLTDPGAIVARVKALGQTNVISGVGPGSPDLLAYNGS